MCSQQQAYQATHTVLQVHTRKLKLDPDVTDDVLRQVARDLPGLSGGSRHPPCRSGANASMLINSDCMSMQEKLHLLSLPAFFSICCWHAASVQVA